MNLLLIPTYNRKDRLEYLSSFYADRKLLVVFCCQGYDKDFIDKLDKNYKHKYLYFDKAIGVGNARIELFKYASKYELDVFMHDDDLEMTFSTEKTLIDFREMHENDYCIFSPAIVARVKKDSLYSNSKHVFTIQYIVNEYLKNVVDKLTKDLTYFEDKEFIHLMTTINNKKCMAIDKKLFSQKFSITKLLSNSTIDKANAKRESLKLLYEKYKEKLVVKENKFEEKTGANYTIEFRK